MSAHTPGPWSQTRHGVYDATGALVATVAIDRDTLMGQVNADSRLIAAAPDLLAALENFAGLFKLLHEHHAHWGDYKAALAAIAKARGES